MPIPPILMHIIMPIMPIIMLMIMHIIMHIIMPTRTRPRSVCVASDDTFSWSGAAVTIADLARLGLGEQRAEIDASFSFLEPQKAHRRGRLFHWSKCRAKQRRCIGLQPVVDQSGAACNS